ncbi:MAG: AAA domain-containing protein, partial [Bacteroidota bacterium]
MEKILKSYLRRLSNLSGNNRSILLLRLLKDQFIDLHDFDFEYGEKSFSIIEALLSGTASVDLCEEVDSHAGLSNEFSRRLRTIERRDRFLFEERGSKDLYVGWPFVRGKFVEGTPVRCPLLFLPVELEKKDQKWHLKRRPDVNLTFNKTFLLAYAFYNQTTLDEELIEAVLDDSGDSIVFRTDLYNLLKNSGVQIDFNSENFADELKFFPQKSKSQLEQEEKNGVLRLQPQAVLGIFPQAGSYLVPDYMELLDRNSDENLEIFFEKKKENFSSEFLKNRVEEEYTFTPLPMDAYQELALRKVKSGNSIVIQGPPGTGKSQLISNLICDFMARGKKVLVVCQKRAALDVVYERLRQKDLSDFVALVHDFKSDRKPIYKQVDNQIESLNVYEQKNNSLDAIHLERTFAQSSRRIDQILEELQEYREALFDESECGRSPKELYLTTDQTADHISMNLEYRSFHFEHLPQVERRFLSYYDLYERFDKRTNFWNTGPSFADFTTGDFLTIKKIIAEVDGLEDSLKGTCNQLGLPSLDFDNVYFFSQKLPEILEIELGLKDPTVYKVFQQLHDETPDESIGWLAQLERNIMTCFKSDGIEQSLKTEELGRFQEVLEAAITARKNPLKWIKWRLLSKNKTFLKRVLVANDLKRTKEAFEILVRRIDNRLNFEHVLSQIQSTVWLHNFPSGFRKIDIQDWFYLQKAGLNIYTVAQSVRSLRESINPLKFGHQNYLSAIKKLFKLCNDLVSQLVSWEKYIGLHQVRAIVLGKEKVKPLENTLKKDFDALCRYHQERRDLSSHERKVFDEIIEQSSTSKRALNSLKNSIGLAWLEHLEVKFPNLRDVSSGKVEALAEELREEIRQKRKVSKDILLLKARENTYRNVEYNRLNNRVTYRELQHQVTKKRMVWPIRKVVSEFSEELLNLLPCWMSSPETVSAIFPLEAVFDLVIFDEASQCFSERGIPAMYRGRQVVVA